MKITLDLDDVQVAALKAYIKSSTEIKKPSKEDIKSEIRGFVDSCMQSGALGDFYMEELNKQRS